MRVYRRRDQFDYPDDMKRLLEYLNENGEILVKASTIQTLYREFSDEKYCAGWMGVDDLMCAEFEEWLNDYDL